jgi:hypothetical protein
MRVRADAYPVTAYLYLGTTLKHTVVISSEEPVRLPEDMVGRKWHVKLSGTAEVSIVDVAESMEDLGRAG